MNQSEITRVLTGAAEQAGLTQAEIGARAGLSRQGTNAILAGKDARLSTVLALADALGLALVVVPKVAAASTPTHVAAPGAPPAQHVRGLADTARGRADAIRARLAARDGERT